MLLGVQFHSFISAQEIIVMKLIDLKNIENTKEEEEASEMMMTMEIWCRRRKYTEIVNCLLYILSFG